MKSGCFRYIISLAGLVLWLAALAHSPSAVAQSRCSSTYDATKSYCTQRVIYPWKWYWRISNGVDHGPYDSESTAIQNAISVSLVTIGSSWCTMTLDHVNPDTTPVTSYGVPKEYVHAAYFYVTEFKQDPVPCEQDYLHSYALTQKRTLDCPESLQGGQEWNFYVDAVLGPYCAIPWNEVFDREPKLCKANPCDVLHNAKFQFELDYAGTGPFPLRFERTYESRSAFKHYQGGITQEFFTPLGIGWTATYFQSIWYAVDAQRKGAAVRRPDGRRIYYTESSGVMSAQAGVKERLIKLVDGSGNHTGWQLITADDETESYDPEGRLTSIQNRNGLTQTLTYSGAARSPQSVTDAFGRTLTFTYDTATIPRLIAITLPDSNQITFTYNSSQNLLTAAYPGSLTRQYHYELTNERKNLLTGVTDEAGVRYATWTYASYSGGGIPTSSKHAGDVDLYTFAFTSTATRTVTDPLGQVRVYGSTVRKGQRLLTSSTFTTPGSNEPKTMTYDNNGNIATRKDFNNNEARFSYDLTRNLETSRTEAYGTAAARTITTQWDPTFRLPMQIEDTVSRTTLSYDTNGTLLSRTVLDLTTSQSRTWTYTYNGDGQILTENGPRTDVSDVTTYTYYTCSTGAECGQLHTVTDAANHTTTFNTYNAHGQPLTIADPNGVVTTLTYDGRQRLTSRTVGSESTTFEYWPTGLLRKTTLPDGSFALYTYDDAHRLIKIEDGDGNRIEYTLDNMGNRTADNVYDPSSTLVRTRTQVFNTLNQLWKQLGAAGTSAVTTTYAYDTNSNQTSAAAPLSRTTGQLYDEFNRLKQITDPGSGVTLFGYDANDNLASVSDPRGKVTSYTYDGLGDLTQQVSPDTGTTVNTYDSGGNLATTTDARSKTGTYGYDALNRVILIAHPDRTVTYTYDSGTNGIGRLTGASDSAHSLAWSYDPQGRVTGKGQTIGAVTKSIGYGYTDGNLTSLVTPSGQTITYGYANGRIDSITLNGSTTILNDVLYEPFGPLSGWTWGNSSIAARVYDLDGNPTDLDSAGAYTYSHDDAFRITGIADLADSNNSWTYGYDLLDRLNAASRTSETIGYTYDANGNRLSQTGTTAASYTVSSTGNRVTSITGTPARTYSYDAAGNVTGYAGLTFTYTDAGRMSSSTSGATTTTYLVNALGQRVKKSNSSTTLLFMYDEAGHLIGEYDGAGALVQETLWMDDVPVATLRPNGSGGVNAYYVHTDHLNTPRRVSRPSDNAILWRWDSDPFGSTSANEDPDADTVAFNYNLRFPGQYFDTESGLNYNYFRDYDPATGRYLEADPIGLNGGINPYRYAYANPIEYIDPEGLAACTQLMCFPGFAKDDVVSSKLIDPGKWALINVSVDPPRPRMMPPMPDKDPIGDLSGQQTALCFFAKTRSYREEHYRYRQWKCLEICEDCGQTQFKWTSYVEPLGSYETIRREREQQVRQIRAMIPYIRCREILRELR